MDAKREASRLVEEANQNTVEVSEEYERKIATMNKSLFTLQKIVKAMSDDTGLVRGGDMSAQLLKFRKEWEEQVRPREVHYLALQLSYACGSVP